MKPEDMTSDAVLPPYELEFIIKNWPQAKGELTGFYNALRRNAGITAAQLQMALQLADERYTRLVAESTYYVLVSKDGGVFVKSAEFFVAQGGTTELWGQNWKKVYANSIEEAREKGKACEGTTRG